VVALILGAAIWDRVSDAPARTVPWRDLTAEVPGLEFPRQTGRAYRSRTKLADYLRAIMPGRAPAPPRIDFSRDEAVLVGSGPRSSTGYDLRVVRVEERGDTVDVRVRERTPSLGEPTEARITYPYRLIVFKRIDKPVHVIWEGR
jgi:protease stability complex PrcB-like protein